MFCGSRGWRDNLAIRQAVEEEIACGPFGLVHGKAPGTDRQAAKLGRDYGIPVLDVDANWDYYGKAAGHIRNGWMLDLGPERVRAFWDGESPGTGGMIHSATLRGIETITREIE